MNTLLGPVVRLLLLGAAPRIAIALVLIAVLWAGFFWATSPIGGA